MEEIRTLVRKLISVPIFLYQYLFNPILAPSCRFYPSCSRYALDAIAHYGIIKGCWLAGRRLIRCHPWSDGGYDPVLSNEEKSEWKQDV